MKRCYSRSTNNVDTLVHPLQMGLRINTFSLAATVKVSALCTSTLKAGLDLALTCSLTFVGPDGPMLPKLLYGVHAYTPAASSLTVAMNREPSGVKVHPGYWEKKKKAQCSHHIESWEEKEVAAVALTDT